MGLSNYIRILAISRCYQIYVNYPTEANGDKGIKAVTTYSLMSPQVSLSNWHSLTDAFIDDPLHFLMTLDDAWWLNDEKINLVLLNDALLDDNWWHLITLDDTWFFHHALMLFTLEMMKLFFLILWHKNQERDKDWSWNPQKVLGNAKFYPHLGE